MPRDAVSRTANVERNGGPGYTVTGQKPPDNKPIRIIEEIIAKYAVDAGLMTKWEQFYLHF